MLADELCALTDGGCAYGGKELRLAHKGLGIADVQWNAFVSALGDALKDAQIDDDDPSEFLLRLAPLKDAVLSKGKK